MAQQAIDIFGVPKLDRLHERRDFGRNWVQTLALRRGERARIGAYRNENWQPDGVEAGNVGQPSDPQAACQCLAPLQRFGWRARTMSTDHVPLRMRVRLETA